MPQPPHRASDFPERFGGSINDEQPRFATLRIPKHENVYLAGDRAETVYFIEAGQVKLLMPSLDGKECLLSIHTAGDMFGELCLLGAGLRQEMATAMEDTTLKCIPSSLFITHLSRHSLVEGFVQYLVSRIADQQQTIAQLITVDSEHRLGETLLTLARTLGKQDPRSKRIEQKITHEELSQMIGTTRPRVTKFMLKFRSLGLITVSPEHFLIVNEKKLAAFLTQIA
ncbi:MAG TPA: Crp/Fnr family transcriptional regulator [Pyrinomonadaceae bacterium]|nr:Crp/Fnr family transcriptional regulator [Pyrinomonadaceae bacterium]